MTNDQRRQMYEWRSELNSVWVGFDIHWGPDDQGMTLVERKKHRRRVARQKKLHP